MKKQLSNFTKQPFIKQGNLLSDILTDWVNLFLPTGRSSRAQIHSIITILQTARTYGAKYLLIINRSINKNTTAQLI